MSRGLRWDGSGAAVVVTGARTSLLLDQRDSQLRIVGGWCVPVLGLDVTSPFAAGPRHHGPHA